MKREFNRRLIVVLAVLACAAPRMAPAQDVANGVFLVAQPSLDDPAFRRTVILITQLPAAGPIGVIINRPVTVTLREALPQHEALAALPQSLHFGGPVAQQHLIFLVRTDTPPPRSIAVMRDVYLMGDADWIDGALKAGNTLSAVRVYAGHSAWAPGQLQNELKREGWYMVPADSDTIFDSDSASAWQELVNRAVLRPISF